jgi:phosphatidylethanolamine-binding protein (PEBP) family uncharacterized protein
VFTVYALDVEHLGVDAGFSPAKLEPKLSAHSLGHGTITGVFER